MTDLEKRISALEKEIADLKRQLEGRPIVVHAPISTENKDDIVKIVLDAFEQNHYSLREAILRK